MSDWPIGWGVVGFGWVARDYFAPAVREAGDRLVAICDPGAVAREKAERAGIAAYDDLAAFLADPALDAIYVATPNHLHRGAVEAAASAGKPVLCEKPMAAQLRDAEAMAAAVERSGILYGTAFDQRHHPAHRALRDLIAAGRLGTVTAVRIVYACWLDSRWSACAGQENWRIDQAKAGGGALMDLAPHGLDLVSFLLGEPLAQVAAFTQAKAQDYAVDDGALLMARTQSGALAQLHVAYNCPDALPRRRLEVMGTKGLAVAVNTMGQTAGGELTLIHAEDGRVEPIPFSDASPFTEQVRAFSRALRSGDRGGYSVAHDLHTMRLLDAAYRFAASSPSPLEREGGPRVSEGRERGSAPPGAHGAAGFPTASFASRAPAVPPSPDLASRGHPLPRGERESAPPSHETTS
jgi:predicted dehydrogenase